ncbi:type II secretion system protein [Paenisporosarcina sp. TG-14]|uniref:type II secretion system protein n=1 Tax=Paenisporosarcina sp. TG-14 TaxID=1231057 RepID=UPI00036D605A|nr:type II secretion system protein [Paenisporosarcina sp. TG-14]
MKLLKSEKGITLIELIAALALVSMVAVLIMTTLSIGIQRSVVESQKTKIQQEANLITSKLLNIHRSGNCYQIDITENNDLQVLTYDDPNQSTCENVFNKTITINNADYDISTMNSPLPLEKINPTKENNSISIVLTLESRRTINYEISTTLSRYKTN